jgi:hypothetical protein
MVKHRFSGMRQDSMATATRFTLPDRCAADPPACREGKFLTMKHKMLRIAAASAAVIAFAATLPADEKRQPIADPTSAPDVTEQVENLGIPFQKRYPSGQHIYARNPWDLRAFDGRLYVGAGNSNNLGPAPNAGPVPILSHDLDSGEVTKEFQVDDEQIDVFYVFDGRLVTPGHDPKESWALGNFYRLEPPMPSDGPLSHRERARVRADALPPSERWKKHRNIPGAIHTYGMTQHDGKFFAGLGIHSGAAAAVSDDDGASWTVQQLGGRRIYSLAEVGGRLFAFDVSRRRPANRKQPAGKKPKKRSPVHEYGDDGRFHPREDINRGVLFPGLPKPADLPDMEKLRKIIQQKKRLPPELVAQLQAAWAPMKVVHPVRLGDATVYLGTRIHVDHQFLPVGVWVARSFEADAVDVERLTLPDGWRAWDVMVRDGVLYLLLEGPQADRSLPPEEDRRVPIAVIATRDLTNWRPVLRFTAPTFARSFELVDGQFYFGLGCTLRNARKWEQNELHPATGTLLRVPSPPAVPGIPNRS